MVTVNMPSLPCSVQATAKLLDHTILKPTATSGDILRVAEEGLEYNVAAVCVHPYWVVEVAEVLRGSKVHCCSVAGFPSGIHHEEVVAREAAKAVENGADEIDMVIHLGLVKEKAWERLGTWIAEVRKAVSGSVLKVILETCELDDEEIRMAAKVALDAGADFLKTSTGFGKHGATVHAVQLLSEIAAGRAGVKAAGGIRSLETLLEMVRAGATRIGTSSTKTILEQAKERFG